MLDSLFEGSAFKVFLVRWFGRERPTNAGRRGRQARLAVVDAANVDGRRKLVLIRRDNLEHLVLIGGPSDVLIEPNIAAGAAPREVPPPRPVPTGDTLRRAVPLGEGNSRCSPNGGRDRNRCLAPNRSRCDRRRLRLNQPRTGRRANRRSLNPREPLRPGTSGGVPIHCPASRRNWAAQRPHRSLKLRSCPSG
jgi:flagellar protein FliO/FliZ